MLPLEQLQAGLVLPIDKPYQWTSFQAVNKVKATIRRLYDLKKFKIGHAGTLDPLATGLLLVCVGKATKDIERLQAGEKVYCGTMVFGATTPCYDLERAVDKRYPSEHITMGLLEEAKRQFVGDVMQVPPMFSAVKIAGQRAYTYARQDDPEAVIAPKRVHIEEFELSNFRYSEEPAAAEPIEAADHHLYDHPQGIVPGGLPMVDFRIRCGKGTYIRSIARDMGLAVDSGAFLSALRRERVGEYAVERALQLDEVEHYLNNKE